MKKSDTQGYFYLQDEFKKAIANLSPKLVLHIGAREADEAAWYRYVGADVIWVEANPELIKDASKNAKQFGQKVIEATISDTNDTEVTFNIANNSGHSSSFLSLKDHKILHPEVHYIKTYQQKTATIDSLNIKPTILNLDIQGAEGLAIKGATETLKTVQVIYSEVNFMECYCGCILIDDFDKLLPDFERIHTYTATKGWGDAIYRRVV